MIIHNIIASTRYLLKHKSYLFLNIAGLTAGLMTFLFIGQFLLTELSFDRFHPDSELVVRIGTQYAPKNDKESRYVNSPPALIETLVADFSEIEAATRMRFSLRILLANGDRQFYEETGFYADSLFFEVLPFQMIAGNPSTALDEVNAIVMTEKMAMKYFDQPRPLGKQLLLNDETVLTVTGIIAEVPVNSHLQFDYLISFPTYRVPEGYTSNLSSWSWAGFLTYARMQPGFDANRLQSEINELYAEKMRLRTEFVQTAIVQTLPDLYLGTTNMEDDLNSGLKTGNSQMIYALALIGILVLVIAGFNFINLTSAIFLNRGKELSVRKLLGSGKLALASQLIVESLVIALISFVFALVLMLSVNDYVMRWFDLSLLSNISVITELALVALSMTIIIGFAAGLYPALSLASFDTVKVLKGNLKVSIGSGSWMRNGLVVVQFSISIGLIVATLVVTRQLQHLQTRSMGIDDERVLVVKLLPEHMGLYYSPFRERLRQNSNVVSVSQCERLVGDPWPMNPIRLYGQPDAERKVTAGNLVGEGFIDALGLRLVEGRDFDPAIPTDSLNAIIVNQQTVKQLGLTDPIGEQIRFFSINGPRTIIGVVEDFNFSSLHDHIGPMVLVKSFIEPEYLIVRVTPGLLKEKVEAIDDAWRQVTDGIPLEITFMDDHLNSLYHSEERFSKIIFSFSLIAVILSCLGLYGLVSFTINNRLREVSIRKVLGASMESVFWMLSRQYIKLVLVSGLLILPVITFYLDKWLNSFAYRIELTSWFFVTALGMLLLITFSTISYQLLKAARVNPVQSIRGE